MNKRSVLMVVLSFILSACSVLTTTAKSVNDLRVEVVRKPIAMKPVKFLDCTTVVGCKHSGLNPDMYLSNSETEEIYIWSQKYDFFSDKVFVYVVAYRPNDNTWDGLGFENIDNVWTAGIYGGQMHVGKTSVPIWYKVPVESNTVAIGIRGEPWAMVVTGLSMDTFKYSFVADYWNKR